MIQIPRQDVFNIGIVIKSENSYSEKLFIESCDATSCQAVQQIDNMLLRSIVYSQKISFQYQTASNSGLEFLVDSSDFLGHLKQLREASGYSDTDVQSDPVYVTLSPANNDQLKKNFVTSKIVSPNCTAEELEKKVRVLESYTIENIKSLNSWIETNKDCLYNYNLVIARKDHDNTMKSIEYAPEISKAVVYKELKTSNLSNLLYSDEKRAETEKNRK